MIKLKDIKNQKINNTKIVEILFYSFPLSFILGNLIINLHLLAFIIASFFLINKRELKTRFKSYYWILISFFLYFFLLTSIQFHYPEFINEKIKDWPFESQPMFKSFIFVRFIILIFIVDTLFLNKILSLKKLFLFSLLCTSFVSFDIILQYFTGTDLFGYKTHKTWNSGPFGDEFIAGGYLQKFSFLSFFYFLINKDHNKNQKLIIILIIVSHLVAMLFAGNKMSFLLSIFGCGLLVLFIRNIRIVMSVSLICFLGVFLILIQNDTKLKSRYVSLFNEINVLNIFDFSNKTNTKEKKENTDEKIKVTHEWEGIKTEWSEGIWRKNWEGIIILRTSGYNRIFRTAIAVWKENPIFGSGLKSFRILCWEVGPKYKHLEPKAYEVENTSAASAKFSIFSCSTHPHNYYLELLSESGLVGTILMIAFFLVLLSKSFHHLKLYSRNANPELLFLIPFIVVIFIDIWPLRSSGSFFTSGNATFFWLSIAIFLANQKMEKN